MIEFYPHTKWVRIACVLASGGMLFAVRDLLLQPRHGYNARRIFVRQWHEGWRSNPRQPLLTNESFRSVPMLRPDLPGLGQTARIFGARGLHIRAPDTGQDCLLILRAALMNPFLIEHENGINHVDRYFHLLGRRVRALLGPTGIKR